MTQKTTFYFCQKQRTVLSIAPFIHGNKQPIMKKHQYTRYSISHPKHFIPQSLLMLLFKSEGWRGYYCHKKTQPNLSDLKLKMVTRHDST